MAKTRVNWGSLPAEGPVKLFEVFNTANNGMLVLAPNEKAAMSIAYSANHVYMPDQKFASNYSRAAHEVRGEIPKKLKAHSHTLEKAIARCLQGTVHIDEGRFAIGYEVID